MSEDEQRQLFSRCEELRLSAALEGARPCATRFDVMQHEARRAAMRLVLACVTSGHDLIGPPARE
jgi:hypothetical protein